MDLQEMLNALKDATQEEWETQTGAILAAYKEQADTVASLQREKEAASAKIKEMTTLSETHESEMTALKARNWDLLQAVGTTTSDDDAPDDPGDDDGYNGGIDALFSDDNN